MPRQAGPRWNKRRNCYRARFPGAEYAAPRDIHEVDVAAAWKWYHEVAAEYQAQRKEANQTARRQPSDQPLSEICRRYLAWLQEKADAGGCSPDRIPNITTQMNFLFRHSGLAGCLISQLTTTKVAEFINCDAAMRSRPSYLSNIIASLQTILNWAANPVPLRNPERLIAANPLVGLPVIRVPRTERFLELEKIRRFLRKAWGHCRTQKFANKKDGKNLLLLFRLMSLTGMRPKECYRLTWEEVYWRDRLIRIPYTRHKTGRKTLEDRIVVLTPPVARLLKAVQRCGERDDGFVFGNARGPWSRKSISMRIVRWREATGCGQEFIPYANRHAYCSEALANGTSFANLAKLVGSSIRTLEKNYFHAVRDKLEEEANTILSRRRRTQY